ncbi:hypothetical protein pb186bvf_017367 [Paramecium bursaria]
MKFKPQVKNLSIILVLTYSVYYAIELISNYNQNFQYLKLAIFLVFISRLSQLPITRQVSKLTGIIASLTIPKFLRKPLFSIFCEIYGVRRQDMIQPLEYYQSFNAFFTRKIKTRKIEQGIISPCDSKILSITKVLNNECLLVKKVNYNIGQFLTGQKGYDMELSKRRHHKDTQIYSCILYLAPGDYHRYHSPVDFIAKSRLHIPGKLAPVKESNLKSGLYEGNERVVLEGEWEQGFMYITFVGATNVGSMTVNFDEDLQTNQEMNISFKDYSSIHSKSPYQQSSKGVFIKKGEEIGRFNMGSTVVLIFEGNVDWVARSGQKIRFGQCIGQ